MTPASRPATRRTALPALALCLALAAAAAPLGCPARAGAQEPPPPGLPLAVASYAPVPLNFGYVSIRAVPPSTLVSVRNLGSDDLVVSSLTPSDPAFTVDVTSMPPIPAGSTAAFRVSFHPDAAGVKSATIVVGSNDAFNPTYALPVQGVGIDVGVTVTPAERVMVPRQALQFQAAVTGAASNPTVAWSVVGIGTISASGVYTAPDSLGTATIRATSNLDPETTASAQIQVVPPDIPVDADPAFGGGRYGARVTTADLDGDGNIEVLVAAPEADVDGPGGPVSGAGAVWIRTFEPDGFSGAVSRLISPDPVSGGGFGTSLLAADYNDDGRMDVAVGEPGAGGGTGAVHVFFGDGAGGFDASPVTSAPADLAPGDEFGAAMAQGYLAEPGLPLLVVGAPGHAVNAQPQAGAVYVVDPLTGDAPTTLTAPEPETAAAFGSALAVACLDGCTRYGGAYAAIEALQKDDLIVGAPGAPVPGGGGTLAGAGRVFAFPHSVAIGPEYGAAVEVPSPFPAAGAAFGAALAAGDLTNDAIYDVVVGAPGQAPNADPEAVGAGVAYVLVSDGHLAFAPFMHLRDRTLEAGEGFGSTLVMGDEDRDGRTDLTVGTPAPGGTGRITVFYGSGEGDFLRMRLFVPPAPEPGGSFGAAVTWRDLNLDGRPDLIVGAPDAEAGGTAGAGTLLVRLDLPPAPIAVTPRRVTRSRLSAKSQTAQFVSSVPPEADVWSVLSGTGRVDTDGLYTAPSTIGTRLTDSVLVGVSDKDDASQWALARVNLVGSSTVVYNPHLAYSSEGVLQLSVQPEEGAQFGASVAVAPIGRLATDPHPNQLSVLGSFLSVSSTQIPRVPRFPYDDLSAPFTSIQLYLGQPTAARTGWGAQLTVGDFNGDGNEDFAVSAPFAPSTDSAEVQIGFVDIYLLDAQGSIAGAVVRYSPARSMLAPDGTPLWMGPDARSNARYGYRLAAADLNGDGRDDLIVGMPHADLCTADDATLCQGPDSVPYRIRDAGVVEVLLMPASGNLTDPAVRATLTEDTPRAWGYFGTALGLGDTTGDGVPELFVGAPGSDPQGQQLDYHTDGRVVGFAPSTWNYATSENLRTALGAAPRVEVADPEPPPANYYNAFGTSLHLGDLVPGEGADELAVGAPTRILVDPVFRMGAADPPRRETGGVDLFTGDGGFTLRHLGTVMPPVRQTGMRFGEKLATAHLAGASGPLTLVVSAPYYDTSAGPNAGALFLYDDTGGPLPRYRDTLYAPEEGALDQFGQALAVGDVDLDGTDELVAGAPNADISQVVGIKVYPSRHRAPDPLIATSEHAGKVYVIFPQLP